MAKESEVSPGAQQCPRKPPLERTNSRKEEGWGWEDGEGMCRKGPQTERPQTGAWGLVLGLPLTAV